MGDGVDFKEDVKKDVNEGTDPKDEGVFGTAVTDAIGEDVNEGDFTEIDVTVGGVSCDALRLSARGKGVASLHMGRQVGKGAYLHRRTPLLALLRHA